MHHNKIQGVRPDRSTTFVPYTQRLFIQFLSPFQILYPGICRLCVLSLFLIQWFLLCFFLLWKYGPFHPFFGDKVISNKTANIWSPHSPDLNPPDFFLWGFLKDNVYVNRPQTIAALKEEITRVIDAITRATCQRVIENFKKRIDTCIVRDGGHLEHILEHKGW